MTSRLPRVLIAIPEPARQEHDYIAHIVNAFPGRIAVCYFSWSTLLKFHYDIVHLHWPERLWRGKGNACRRLTRLFLLTASLICARLIGKPVVMTVHNISPHERGSLVERLLYRVLVATVSMRVLLNDSIAVRGRSVLIPHAHYREVFESVRAEGPREGILFMGLLRKYKGVESLLTAYDEWPRRDVVGLRVMGEVHPSSTNVVAELDQRTYVNAELRRHSDADMATAVRRSRMIVLPYANVYNSGILLFALSGDCPVLAPRSASVTRLRAEVGEEWIHLFDPPLTAAALEEAFEWASTSRPRSPRLGGRTPGAVSMAHIDLYERLIRQRRVLPGWVSAKPMHPSGEGDPDHG